jgi:hypothetical protein
MDERLLDLRNNGGKRWKNGDVPSCPAVLFLLAFKGLCCPQILEK